MLSSQAEEGGEEGIQRVPVVIGARMKKEKEVKGRARYGNEQKL